MDLIEIAEKQRLSREAAAARLHAIADALARNNDIELERGDLRITVHVPDEVDYKIEVEVDDDGHELEIVGDCQRCDSSLLCLRPCSGLLCVRVGLGLGQHQLDLRFCHGDREAQGPSDAGGAGKHPWRTDDGGDGNEYALDVLEGDSDVGGGTGVHEVRRVRSAHRDQRSQPGKHVLARFQGAFREGYGGDCGEGVEDGGVLGHLRSPLSGQQHRRGPSADSSCPGALLWSTLLACRSCRITRNM
jgi:amphi-Trp domain-containing protein